MVMRNAKIIGAAVLFGLVAAAAVIWGYAVKSPQNREASVEVQQMQERSWGVEVKEMPPDADMPTSDEGEKILVAEH